MVAPFAAHYTPPPLFLSHSLRFCFGPLVASWPASYSRSSRDAGLASPAHLPPRCLPSHLLSLETNLVQTFRPTLNYTLPCRLQTFVPSRPKRASGYPLRPCCRVSHHLHGPDLRIAASSWHLVPVSSPGILASRHPAPRLCRLCLTGLTPVLSCRCCLAHLLASHPSPPASALKPVPVSWSVAAAPCPVTPSTMHAYLSASTLYLYHRTFWPATYLKPCSPANSSEPADYSGQPNYPTQHTPGG